MFMYVYVSNLIVMQQRQGLTAGNGPNDLFGSLVPVGSMPKASVRYSHEMRVTP